IVDIIKMHLKANGSESRAIQLLREVGIASPEHPKPRLWTTPTPPKVSWTSASCAAAYGFNHMDTFGSFL
ncbi:MAG: hypothetical protein QW318_09155, partial [Candidatus Caldarchaeum sp.]